MRRAVGLPLAGDRPSLVGVGSGAGGLGSEHQQPWRGLVVLAHRTPWRPWLSGQGGGSRAERARGVTEAGATGLVALGSGAWLGPSGRSPVESLCWHRGV